MSGFWRLMLFGKGPREAASPGRDLRIDVIRGLILLVIFVNHMPGNIVSTAMPHNYGFSDAADIFVLLAGISAAFAYGRLIDQRGLLVGSRFPRLADGFGGEFGKPGRHRNGTLRRLDDRRFVDHLRLSGLG